jgi:hypothetical protein
VYELASDAPIRPSYDVDALGQALDTTWGRSSTPKTSSYSVKLTMSGPDRLIASYAAIVNFGTEKEMILMKRMYADESKSVTDAYVKSVKSRYKDLTGSTLKLKEISATDSLEIINFGVHNPKRTAYYRRKAVFEVA